MIWGTVKVKDSVIETNKYTFVLSVLTNFGVERPFLIPSRLLSGAFVGFTIAFSDLLYPIEIFLILGASGLSIFAGAQIAQLRLHGGDLRGTTLGHALWGTHSSLQNERAKIADKISPNTIGGAA